MKALTANVSLRFLKTETKVPPTCKIISRRSLFRFMFTMGGVEIRFHIFLTSAQHGKRRAHQHSRLGSGEGPRSRRYGRTAALRLLVRPCDEDDEDDDDYFLSIS
jgi:hypothetical protein